MNRQLIQYLIITILIIVIAILYSKNENSHYIEQLNMIHKERIELLRKDSISSAKSDSLLSIINNRDSTIKNLDILYNSSVDKVSLLKIKLNKTDEYIKNNFSGSDAADYIREYIRTNK